MALNCSILQSAAQSAQWMHLVCKVLSEDWQHTRWQQRQWHTQGMNKREEASRCQKGCQKRRRRHASWHDEWFFTLCNGSSVSFRGVPSSSSKLPDIARRISGPRSCTARRPAWTNRNKHSQSSFKINIVGWRGRDTNVWHMNRNSR